ncbi:MAG: V-type ATP synthase subunit D [Burkholderiaceae bacterium]
MSEAAPSRSQILEFREERRAMADGYSFLDEKCLLLAGEILRELARHAELRKQLLEQSQTATATLAAAIHQHGLEGLELHPPADLSEVPLTSKLRILMGVKLIAAHYPAHAPLPPGLIRSHQAELCAAAFAALTATAAALGAVAANLERLAAEYRRAIRRARALHDVLLPELDGTLLELETRLEDLEREDAIAMRLGVRAS